ncbi:hypothetical protein NLX83_27310 [Allokutzneria sp. A3M-2-11 16]|uniref:zf-HC2 domain-containing protein n=1 Tax=Allokutzneria sp. A3M-2-11 16 TaxID=2962043 RepID=UPI0020B6414D|nr:zf-HC2 domain-containing protein [Allokutzneria sp. A3M-2-11 16]MCP3802988.1 hypothetical protein [Allokutzneria sp. A3M-2-11 16]
MSRQWHVPAPTLVAYAVEDLSDVDSWSVEAHLVACADCRAALTRASAGTPAAATVGLVHERMALDLPAQRAPASRLRQFFLLLRGAPGARASWLLALGLVLVAATALDATIATAGLADRGTWWFDHGSYVVLVAPLLQIAGVALSYGPWIDPCHEMTGSSPLGGLRLLLIRTALVLAAVVPATLLLGMVTGRGTPVLTLLPGLGLTTLTLALGSVVQLRHAALAVGGAWLAVSVAPLLVDSVPYLLASPRPAVWVPVIVLSSATVLLRRRSFTYAPQLVRS